MTKYPVVQLRWISTIARSTFTFARGLSYIVSFSFTRVNFTCVRTEKLRDSGNQPLRSIASYCSEKMSLLSSPRLSLGRIKVRT